MVEKRAFGRTVLVGTHVVSDVMKFSPRELEEELEDVPKGELLGMVPEEAAGKFCQWQRILALLLPLSQAAESPPESHTMSAAQCGAGSRWRQVVSLVCSTWLQPRLVFGKQQQPSDGALGKGWHPSGAGKGQFTDCFLQG